MPDITRHSPLDETEYAVTDDIETCDPIDMRPFAGAIIIVLSDDIDKLIPYVAQTETGTYYQLFNDDMTDPTVNSVAQVCAIDMPGACYCARWLKFKCASATGGTIRIVPKG